MPAPSLPHNASLDELRSQIVHTRLALGLDPDASDLVAPFDALFEQHQSVAQGQNVRWDAQTLAGLMIRRADRALDRHVEAFVADLVYVHGDRDAQAVQHYLRGRTVSEIKRTVLGPEVDTVGEWITSIASEASKKLRAWGPVFEADLAAAEAATREAVSADTANRLFREKGPLAALLTALSTARDELYNKLDARRLAQKGALDSAWVASFFAPSKRPTPDADARRARAEAKAARRAETERKRAARAEALLKLREARAALDALKKKKK